jgi:hypothetical protein
LADNNYIFTWKNKQKDYVKILIEAGNEDNSTKLEENSIETDIASTRFEKYLTKEVKLKF